MSDTPLQFIPMTDEIATRIVRQWLTDGIPHYENFRYVESKPFNVLAALPATMREIAAITGRTPHQVNASLDHYRRRGMVKRGRTVPTGNARGQQTAAIWERVE